MSKIKCPKLSTRTLFTLTNIYLCKCKYTKTDELIAIGNSRLYIFYEVDLCEYLVSKEELNLYCLFNHKIKMLLTTISNYGEVLFLWLNNIKNLNKYFDVLESFLDDYNRIIILACE